MTCKHREQALHSVHCIPCLQIHIFNTILEAALLGECYQVL